MQKKIYNYKHFPCKDDKHVYSDARHCLLSSEIAS